MIGWLLAAALLAQRAELPEFVTGDQCLFCHRADIGPTWQSNPHGATLKAKGESGDLFTLGRRELKKTGYGRLAIQEADGSWNASKFGERCAGCHTTAVDSKTRTFAAIGIDCYSCHGVVNLEHSNDTSLVLLSKKNRAGANTICASCHMRGAKSRSTGLPYPNNYVPGDALFPDWQGEPEAGDRHVWQSIRGDVACLSCHQVHANSTARHRRVLTSAICNGCHLPEGPKKNVRAFTPASALCEY